MEIALILGGLALVTLAAVAWKRHWFARKEPAGWFAGPLAMGKNRSANVVAAADGSFTFPAPAWGDGHVHYLTRRTGPVKGAITVRFRIEAEPGVAFVNDTGGPASVSLYIAHKRNDWRGKMNHERLFGTVIPLEPGDHTLSADEWVGVHRTATTTDIADTMANAGRVGLVFGGGTGRGHGAFATGAARFVLLEFSA